MRPKIILSICMLASACVQAQRSQAYADYINQYKDIAIQEFQRAGVPASITLAQAVVESGAGTSELAQKANNHFGIKARSNWTGEVYHLNDDDRDAQGNVVPSPFRKYATVEASYKDHSDFLRANRRYDICFAVTPPTDYKTWARKLLEAGYATAQNYPEMLIYVIELYELHQYDTGVTPGNLADADAPKSKNGIISINDVKAIYVSNNMNLEQIAGRYNVSLSKLKDYNENLTTVRSDQPLRDGLVVFLQRKKRAFYGRTKFHIVKQGERMIDIAQKYGIRLYRLYKKNEMIEPTEPAMGERLILRRNIFEGWQTPQLRDASAEPVNSPIAPPTVPTVPADVTNTGGNVPATPPANGSGFPAAPPSGTPEATETIVTPENSSPAPSSTETTPRPAPVRPVRPPVVAKPTPSKPATKPTPAPTTPSKHATVTKPTHTPTTPSKHTTKPTPAPVTPSKPATVTKPAPTTPSKHTTTPTTGQTHIVEAKETLYSISRKYNTTVENIKKINNLTSDNISVGMKLRVK